MSAMSPYAAHVVVNAVLEEAGVARRIPPQMMYNYTTGQINKGKKTLIETIVGEDGKVLITEAGLTKWLEKYVPAQLAKEGKVAVTDPDLEGEPVEA